MTPESPYVAGERAISNAVRLEEIIDRLEFYYRGAAVMIWDALSRKPQILTKDEALMVVSVMQAVGRESDPAIQTQMLEELAIDLTTQIR